jgi:hypothetical protein
MIYMVIRMFGVIVAVSDPVPHTMTECIKSLEVLYLPPEIQASASCERLDTPPELGELTPEQQQAVDAWVAEQEARL